jgi:hypothetical protein
MLKLSLQLLLLPKAWQIRYVPVFQWLAETLLFQGLRLKPFHHHASQAKVMEKMNDKVDMKSMQKTMAEFSKQNEVMQMKEDMMNDAVDLLDDDDIEVEQVCVCVVCVCVWCVCVCVNIINLRCV